MSGEPFPTASGTGPSTPPPTNGDLNVPRKREREVSLEPTTPSVDLDSARKDKLAAKKNRLVTTQESAEEGSPPRLPALPMSPPHEVKMTSLNQRVSDIQWKNSTARPFVDPEAAHAPEAEMADDAATQHDDDMADAESLKRRSTDSMRSLKRARDAALADDGGRQAKRQSPVDEPEVTPVEAHAPLGKKKSDESIRSIKRHRDEADADANPRETKRPTPPAEEDPKKTPPPTAAHQPMVVSPPATTPKFGGTGFAAFAAAPSPFSAVKGPNVFGSSSSFGSSASSFNNSSSSSFGSSSMAAPSTPGSSADKPAGTKRSGFDAFASAASPFASAGAAKRSKSPPPRPTSPPAAKASPAFASSSFGTSKPSSLARPKSPSSRVAPSANANAFSSYASSGFGGSPFGLAGKDKVAAPEEAKENGKTSSGEEDDEDKKASFSAQLRAQKDKEDEDKEEKLALAEQDDLTTGEEDEETCYSMRAKLYTLHDGNSWKERGTGTLKVNVRRADGAGARLVMRKEAVHSLILNVSLFQGMNFSTAQDPRYIRFSAIEDGTTTHYNLRVANGKIAQEFLAEVRMNVPTS